MKMLKNFGLFIFLLISLTSVISEKRLSGVIEFTKYSDKQNLNELLTHLRMEKMRIQTSLSHHNDKCVTMLNHCKSRVSQQGCSSDVKLDIEELQETIKNNKISLFENREVYMSVKKLEDSTMKDCQDIKLFYQKTQRKMGSDLQFVKKTRKMINMKIKEVKEAERKRKAELKRKKKLAAKKSLIAGAIKKSKKAKKSNKLKDSKNKKGKSKSKANLKKIKSKKTLKKKLTKKSLKKKSAKKNKKKKLAKKNKKKKSVKKNKKKKSVKKNKKKKSVKKNKKKKLAKKNKKKKSAKKNKKKKSVKKNKKKKSAKKNKKKKSVKKNKKKKSVKKNKKKKLAKKNKKKKSVKKNKKKKSAKKNKKKKSVKKNKKKKSVKKNKKKKLAKKNKKKKLAKKNKKKKLAKKNKKKKSVKKNKKKKSAKKNKKKKLAKKNKKKKSAKKNKKKKSVKKNKKKKSAKKNKKKKSVKKNKKKKSAKKNLKKIKKNKHKKRVTKRKTKKTNSAKKNKKQKKLNASFIHYQTNFQNTFNRNFGIEDDMFLIQTPPNQLKPLPKFSMVELNEKLKKMSHSQKMNFLITSKQEFKVISDSIKEAVKNLRRTFSESTQSCEKRIGEYNKKRIASQDLFVNAKIDYEVNKKKLVILRSQEGLCEVERENLRSCHSINQYCEQYQIEYTNESKELDDLIEFYQSYIDKFNCN